VDGKMQRRRGCGSNLAEYALLAAILSASMVPQLMNINLGLNQSFNNIAQALAQPALESTVAQNQGGFTE